ncbi:hypothetical protein D3C72_1282460 [compost metagenome]
MQRQMGGLEEGVPGGQADHVTVMQPFFYRQIVPVKNRIARCHTVQSTDAGTCRFQPGDNLRAVGRLVQAGSQIRPHFAQVGRPPGQRAVKRCRPIGVAHVAPGVSLCPTAFQPGDHVILHRGRVAGGQIDGSALIQQTRHQRGHFQIQVHIARQTHAA